VRRARLALAALLAVVGCATAASQLQGGTPSSCGPRCDSMVCPPDSYCTLDGNCTPHCQVRNVPGRLP